MMKNKLRLKFIGRVDDLIQLGYDERKVFSSKYTVYFKGIPGFEVTVWAKGNDVLLSQSSFDETAVIYQFLQANGFAIPDEHNRITYNEEMNIVEAYDYRKHDVIGAHGLNYSAAERDAHCNTYHVKCITEGEVAILKELSEKKLVEIVELVND